MRADNVVGGVAQQKKGSDAVAVAGGAEDKTAASWVEADPLISTSSLSDKVAVVDT